MGTETTDELEQRIADSINAERADAGLPALEVEVHLNAAAEEHSDWMAGTGDFSHTGEDGSSPTERMTAAGLEDPSRTSENIAYAGIEGELDEGEVDRMHEGLMDSPGHRANILDPDVSYMGVGLSNDGDVAYLTEDFAATDGYVTVEEEVDGRTMLQDYVDGQPVGEPYLPDDDDDDDDDPQQGAPDDDDDEIEAVAASAGGCFVATAAYGSPTHPDVMALRRFRDEVLVRSGSGRAFIALYRTLGPRLARVVAPNRPSGRAARALIAPLARLARRSRR